MTLELGRLECRICGRFIYFPLTETDSHESETLVELTCSRGHTDSYETASVTNLDGLATLKPELARAAIAGI